MLRNVATSLPNYSVISRKTVTTILTALWTLNVYRFIAYCSRKNELKEHVNIGKHSVVQHNKFYEYQVIIIIIIITLIKVRFDGKYIYIYIYIFTYASSNTSQHNVADSIKITYIIIIIIIIVIYGN